MRLNKAQPCFAVSAKTDELDFNKKNRKKYIFTPVWFVQALHLFKLSSKLKHYFRHSKSFGAIERLSLLRNRLEVDLND